MIQMWYLLTRPISPLTCRYIMFLFVPHNEITKSPPTRHASGRKLIGTRCINASTSVSLSSRTVQVVFVPDGRNTGSPLFFIPVYSDFSFPAFHARASAPPYLFHRIIIFAWLRLHLFILKEITELDVFKLQYKVKLEA